MAIRVAARRMPDGSIDYALGFDDTGGGDDLHFSSREVEIVVSRESIPNLQGTEIDYVKLDTGLFGFVFLNPGDPAYQPGQEAG